MEEGSPIVIERTSFLPDSEGIANISVSRLPSGTRINIQAHVFRSPKPGPTVLIMAGVHGDEINGVEIVRRLIDQGHFNSLIKGSVIAVPLLNVYGFINFSREVPDGKDVNRSFPGSKTGSLASRVASALTRKILPQVDYAIDLHTGGGSRYNYPQIRYGKNDEIALEMAKNFAPPFIIQKPLITGSFRKTAGQMDIPVIVYEGGESTRLDGYSIDIGSGGILRTLQGLGMIKDAPAHHHSIIQMTSTGWVRAAEAGIFTWSQSSGAYIRKGEPLGIINSPQGDRTKKVLARRDGYIIGHNNASVVHHGDALFHIAYDGVPI